MFEKFKTTYPKRDFHVLPSHQTTGQILLFSWYFTCNRLLGPSSKSIAIRVRLTLIVNYGRATKWLTLVPAMENTEESRNTGCGRRHPKAKQIY